MTERGVDFLPAIDDYPETIEHVRTDDERLRFFPIRDGDAVFFLLVNLAIVRAS
jgi:hypothetical protein